MTKQSVVSVGGCVQFPEFTGERVYMRRFERGSLLPPDLGRWQATVDAMLDGVASSGPVYLMIDQRRVQAGSFHRRPGLHVDGYWFEGLSAHGTAPYHRGSPPEHRASAPTHHALPGFPGHRAIPSTPGHRSAPPGHTSESGIKEALIIASDVMGCRGFTGEWHGRFGNGGDCSDVQTGNLGWVDFAPGKVWVGETGAMLHESIPLTHDADRTVVRLNVTGWEGTL